jgi:hypothetical protein
LAVGAGLTTEQSTVATFATKTRTRERAKAPDGVAAVSTGTTYASNESAATACPSVSADSGAINAIGDSG